MSFANMYWGCVDQQLEDSSAKKDSDLGAPYIPQSLTSPIFSACKSSLLSLLTTTFESKVLYASPSSRVLAKTPRDFYMPNYEDVSVETRDGKLVHGWLIKRKDPRQYPTILHFHGNACNISHMLYDALGMFQKVKANILLIDYRGYGQSEGSPSEAGLMLDAEAALDYLLRRPDVADPASIFLFGRSLGGAVAIELAARRESAVRGVVVENTFTSIDDLVRHLSPALCRPVLRNLSSKWDTLRVIPQIRRPILFLSGRADEIVPPFMMTALYRAAVQSAGREMAAFPKGRHNSTCLARGYYETMRRFVDRVLVSSGDGAYVVDGGGAGGDDMPREPA
eukprot:CAMPEP_0172174232 /NCGR_PEP_ID=MMETSP1050-20130122/13534_1 /TAXON_ID=233186 /ORGANISM="Cryptomonas curvata, Strain CCAP979/52" /LENGTH=337 /DNA_ID=CAMNT_0012846153 /DNA_START=97 /DNA_END=1107 /DNA_ORIENTATION=+